MPELIRIPLGDSYRFAELSLPIASTSRHPPACDDAEASRLTAVPLGIPRHPSLYCIEEAVELVHTVVAWILFSASNLLQDRA